VTLRIGVAGEHLEITVENPLADALADASPCRPGGGHGLRGIADRARLLGGTARAGAAEGTWRLNVRLPLKGPA
jgi:signal transduction histidine kinase